MNVSRIFSLLYLFFNKPLVNVNSTGVKCLSIIVMSFNFLIAVAQAAEGTECVVEAVVDKVDIYHSVDDVDPKQMLKDEFNQALRQGGASDSCNKGIKIEKSLRGEGLVEVLWGLRKEKILLDTSQLNIIRTEPIVVRKTPPPTVDKNARMGGSQGAADD